MVKEAILLVNIGTPNSPDTADVKKFITDYLTDPHVITLPRFRRHLLVKGVIVPFRAPKSAKAYRQLWTEQGSPLRYYLEALRIKVQEQLGDKAEVWTAMRYGHPNIVGVMADMERQGYDRLTVVPLFPQYTTSTVGTIEDKVREEHARWRRPAQLNIIRHFQFYRPFLELWSRQIALHQPEKYDRVVFAFHGLPLSHLPAACRTAQGHLPCNCLPPAVHEDFFQLPDACYRANCCGFASRVATLAGLEPHRCVVSFQSRLSKGWIQPYTDRVLEEFAAKKMKVLVAALSFVSDCLETRVELDIEIRQRFLALGGQEFGRVAALNACDEWAKVLSEICRTRISSTP
ncbi:MAG: ferrochelatase [Bacteroidales bacterium]|nr:ferrochelatase [Bacteroidales bacterium]